MTRARFDSIFNASGVAPSELRDKIMGATEATEPPPEVTDIYHETLSLSKEGEELGSDLFHRERENKTKVNTPVPNGTYYVRYRVLIRLQSGQYLKAGDIEYRFFPKEEVPR